MSETEELAQEIKALKDETNAVILVHNYQPAEIQEIADFLGDSFALATTAARLPNKTVVFCGVRFMAESAKILSPDKNILMPSPDAGCPMADAVAAEEVSAWREVHPEAVVIAYVNTNADVKAVSDICCTSANGIPVVQQLRAKEILFVPDRNLGAYLSRFVEVPVRLWEGSCYVHELIQPEDVSACRSMLPDAGIVVHPECIPEVVDAADEVLSTDGMVRYARSFDGKEVVIGTEEGLAARLRRENPDKRFHMVRDDLICRDMKRTTLKDVLDCIRYGSGEVEVEERVAERARHALERMLEVV
jgi:quinolinate synthase